jgi:hypothetical protein
MSDFNTPLTSALSGAGVAAMLPSGARTAAVSDLLPDENAGDAKGILVYVVVTAASGTGGLTVSIKAPAPNSQTGGSTIGAASAAVTATGVTTLCIYPTVGSASTYTTMINNTIPPRFTLNVAVGDASSYTYAVYAYLLP